MDTISKSKLKANLLRIFRQIEERGEELIVTDRGRAVLRIQTIAQKKSVEEVFADVRGEVIDYEEINEPTLDEWGGPVVIGLDTAALVSWTPNRARLSSAAAQAIADADRVAVSSMSIWEIAVKVSMGKRFVPLPISEYAARLEQIHRVDLLPVDLRTWLKSWNLNGSHRDPADRTIVATAAIYSCLLLTPDSKIRAFYTQTIW